MVDLHQLVRAVVPHRQPLDLHDRVDVGLRPAAVLRARLGHERKRVLVVDRQRTARSAPCPDRSASASDAEVLQVRVVDREAVVLGAGGELDVLGQQVEHAAALAGRVVARGGRMAVKIGAEPAARVDRRACSLRRERRLLAALHRRSW